MPETELIEKKEGGNEPGKSPWLEFEDFSLNGQKVLKRARPLGDRLMVRRCERKQVEMAGLVIAQPKREEMPVEGVVVSVGDGIKEGSIEVGDVVLFGSDDGQTVKLGLDSKEYLVLSDEHVIAILDKESDLLERDRYSRILLVRNNWILMEWEEATDEIKVGGGKTILRAQTYKQAHFTGVVRKHGPDISSELKDEEIIGKRVFFDRWAYEFREMYWYEPGADERTQKRYAFILDVRIHCTLPDRVKVTSPGHEEVPDEGPSAYKVDVPVRPNKGRVYG